ncbi:MAG TPA: fused MFS/spermidine synthase [Beutenbergiaceae bacterium]|nr:fused MFS/spermidine synthase [Beutenbergiaceae bacterium]
MSEIDSKVVSHHSSFPTGPFRTSSSTVELTSDIDGNGVTLWINGTESSHHDFYDPTNLKFEYMQYFQAILRSELHTTPPTTYDQGRPRVLHIGAAGCTMARAIHAEWPSAHQVAIEPDEELAAKVRTWFNLPRSPHLRIRVQDGLEALEDAPEGRYEFIIRDAFIGAKIPAHLATTGFVQQAARVLGPHGVYMANCADHPPLTLSRREVATAQEAFPFVSAVVEPGVLRGRRYGNVIIIGSKLPLPSHLDRKLRTLPTTARLLTGTSLRRFVGDHKPISSVGKAPRSLA